MENENKNAFKGKFEEKKQSGLHQVSHVRKQFS